MGYIIWLVGQYVLFTGLKILDKTLPWIQIGWSIFQIIVFVASYCYIVRSDSKMRDDNDDQANITTKLNVKDNIRYT